jgi:hypothetical protein
MDESLKDKFIRESAGYLPDEKVMAKAARYLVAAVQLPTGAVELITNTQYIPSKIEYYLKAYDDEFKLKTNPAIQIIGYMLA